METAVLFPEFGVSHILPVCFFILNALYFIVGANRLLFRHLLRHFQVRQCHSGSPEYPLEDIHGIINIFFGSEFAE